MLKFKPFSRNGYLFTESQWRDEDGDFFRAEHAEHAGDLLGRLFPAAPPMVEEQLDAIRQRFGDSVQVRHPYLLPIHLYDHLFWSADRSNRHLIVTETFPEEARLRELDLSGLRGEGVKLLGNIGSALYAVDSKGFTYGRVNGNTILRQEDGNWYLRHPLEARLMGEFEAALSVGDSDWDYNFLAPEVIQGHDSNAQSDIFSLCAVAYFLVTGSKPFDSNSIFGLDPSLLGEVKPRDPREYNEGLDEGLVRLLEHGLSIDVRFRYQRWRDLLSDLQLVMKGETPVIANRVYADRQAWVGDARQSGGVPAFTSGLTTDAVEAVDDDDEGSSRVVRRRRRTVDSGAHRNRSSGSRSDQRQRQRNRGARATGPRGRSPSVAGNPGSEGRARPKSNPMARRRTDQQRRQEHDSARRSDRANRHGPIWPMLLGAILLVVLATALVWLLLAD